MELFQELLLSASLAVFFSFFIAKLVNIALCTNSEHDHLNLGSDFTSEERKFDEIALISEDKVFEEPPSDDIGPQQSAEDLIADNNDVVFEDWEGVERSELEKIFGAAVNFADMEGGSRLLRSEVSLQLYALQKVSMEGPCYEPKPIALRFSARAKWDAWQNLGSMSQNEAMEQFVRILSDNVPGWMSEESVKCDDSLDTLRGTKSCGLNIYGTSSQN